MVQLHFVNVQNLLTRPAPRTDPVVILDSDRIPGQGGSEKGVLLGVKLLQEDFLLVRSPGGPMLLSDPIELKSGLLSCPTDELTAGKKQG